MKIDDYREIEIECDSGSIKLSAWAVDRSGNAPFFSIQTDIDSGHASMTLEQADVFAKKIAELVDEIREAR